LPRSTSAAAGSIDASIDAVARAFDHTTIN
jgi:hypothetical protein